MCSSSLYDVSDKTECEFLIRLHKLARELRNRVSRRHVPFCRFYTSEFHHNVHCLCTLSITDLRATQRSSSCEPFIAQASRIASTFPTMQAYTTFDCEVGLERDSGFDSTSRSTPEKFLLPHEWRQLLEHRMLEGRDGTMGWKVRLLIMHGQPRCSTVWQCKRGGVHAVNLHLIQPCAVHLPRRKWFGCLQKRCPHRVGSKVSRQKTRIWTIYADYQQWQHHIHICLQGMFGCSTSPVSQLDPHLT